MEYEDMIKALNLKDNIDVLQRIKSKVNPEVLEQIEKHLQIDLRGLGDDHNETSQG